MTDPKHDAEWITAMVKLEEERGSIVPGGAQGRPGGAFAEKKGEGTTRDDAVARARRRVRFTFQAIEKASRTA